MKNFYGAGLFALALAATSTVASGSACVIGGPTPSNLLSGAPSVITAPATGSFSCSIGPETFSNFSYNLAATGAGQGVPTVAVEPPSGFANGIVSFDFYPNLVQGSDLQLEFEVSGAPMNGAQLSYNGGAGTGINEEICTTFTITGVCNPANTFLASISVGPNTQSATALFATPQSTIWVFKDISLSTGFFSEVNQGYIVPEPMTFSLLGAGLLGLGLMGRRRASK